MQPTSLNPRTQRARSDATRDALLVAARALFVAKGYAGTSTPEVCQAAGMTRGALYHHFVDKRDLFRQVIERESGLVTQAVVDATPASLGPRAAGLAGGAAYLDAMAQAGRTPLLLVEAPAVLGMAEAMMVDEAQAAGTLRQGLDAALAANAGVSTTALAKLLSAAFDRAALEIDAGAEDDEVRAAMHWLVQRVLGR